MTYKYMDALLLLAVWTCVNGTTGCAADDVADDDEVIDAGHLDHDAGGGGSMPDGGVSPDGGRNTPDDGGTDMEVDAGDFVPEPGTIFFCEGYESICGFGSEGRYDDESSCQMAYQARDIDGRGCMAEALGDGDCDSATGDGDCGE